MAYDRSDWHYDGEFPADLPSSAGGIHIGMFLAWAITRGFEGDCHRTGSVRALLSVRLRRSKGSEFLRKYCEEKFWEDDLNEEGNAFAEDYYAKDGEHGYLADYQELLAQGLPSMYHVKDTWENFDRLSARIDKRFREWRRNARKRRR